MELSTVQLILGGFLLLLVYTTAQTQLDVDLRLGTCTALPAGVTWQSALTAGAGNCSCDRQGVLKLTFLPGVRVRAEIKLTFEQSSGFTFHVGDSATNDGYAGDAGTQQNDAEVHSVNNDLNFYGRDDRVNGGSTGLLHSETSFVGVKPYTTLTLSVKDQLLRASNGVGFLHVQSYNLFQLNGQSDAGGVNYDLYLGMNRVVAAGSYRSGTGLCKVSVQFFSS